ncbi:type IV toxin-antitoxin system AbiEi family antitoxin domain-containing protein [Mycolicibacterium parafortuitum]|uniref:DUF559 domain-containing protein n=1 Tax=Mycolicibacterium parafortuitum TaxID=39692 RepID=A0A375YHE7_MYCPF|nr:type IV toxin-antitoxin system AbiEi family antitoxin domain-containing protein [Mycolicibacterium parafortuitum]ORB25030.1 hypothetical protein BST38_27985 [Mycolicibacterium parafortuitum]SRX80565.1 hypothetical protein [Verrucosispora maris AB-18-032] [Mycolicibacterium parafortuitum]
MNDELLALIDAQHGVATSGQILAHLPRRRFEKLINNGVLERIWQGIYCLGEPDDDLRLRGLDLTTGTRVAVCLGTAAAMHGFDTEQPRDLHVLNPPGCALRDADGLVVHRREGAPLVVVDGRRVTSPAWTAVEVARSLRRPRALATLDAALRSGTCTRADLWRAALEQKGRRGIVVVRNLLPVADERAESPGESVARLAMLDGALPAPQLQYEVVDGNGELRRADFCWPDAGVVAEYDGLDWHSDPDALRRDRQRQLALMAVGLTVIPIVADDLKDGGRAIVARIGEQLARARAA